MKVDMNYLDEIKKLKEKYLELKFAFWQGNSGVDTSAFKKIKRDIARINTFLSANKNKSDNNQ